MADFYQTGVISTLHRLGRVNLDWLETQLEAFSHQMPIALVLPCLYSELEGPALKEIVKQLQSVKYLREIIISLGRADRNEFGYARQFFKDLYCEHRIVWVDGERVQKLLALLTQSELDIGSEGKGRAAWLAYGYVLARRQSKVIALHDCDILTYNREFLARLCYPVVNPNMGYEFCKGYYPRITDQLHGRVTRLFVTPLIRTLVNMIGHHPFLVYLDSFRYPLAGEFSMLADLARVNRIPGDWGLEVGVLAEIYRNVSVKRVCQVDLSDNYEHKHQALSSEDPQTGLMKMAIDIAKSLLRNLATEGLVFDAAFFNTLRTAYQRAAQDTIKKYEDDAIINGLVFDRHAERLAVEAFTRAIRIAAEEFVQDPLGIPLITNWNRVVSAVPKFFEMLENAVDVDNAE
ncbi:MAG TPA: glycosyl transferase [Nitrospiria bacterium]|jgi:glucosyl-3-phosphoglycerate synthase|nr:glycosyl transferase [Nitrospiria bacterium]